MVLYGPFLNAANRPEVRADQTRHHLRSPIAMYMKAPTLFALGLFCSTGAFAQTPTTADSTGLPGDNFSLAGALEMFREAVDLEQFEVALNKEGNHVNNLDLDGNGDIDYIRVETQKDGDAVAITLIAPITKNEAQQVAVIELEKTGEESAIVQIRGDEDLYPEGTIVEPFAETEELKDGKGPAAPELLGVQVVVNVWSWNCPRWCFSPRFIVWNSPWYWGYYPPYWRPWRPHGWSVWYGWSYRHHTWYRPWNTCRVNRAHAIHAQRRTRSAVVQARYRDAHVRHKATRPGRPMEVRPAARPEKEIARPARSKPNKVTPNRTTPKPPRRTAPKPARAPRPKAPRTK